MKVEVLVDEYIQIKTLCWALKLFLWHKMWICGGMRWFSFSRFPSEKKKKNNLKKWKNTPIPATFPALVGLAENFQIQKNIIKIIKTTKFQCPVLF